MALAPKDEAISNSRTRPVIRESSVNRETVEADLKSDTAGVYALALSALAKYHPTPTHKAERASMDFNRTAAQISALKTPCQFFAH
jgi:hypothetical protein